MNKKHTNKKKIIFALLFSAILTSGIVANVAMPQKNVSPVAFEIENDEDIKTLSPFQIQGNFETGWKMENFWNSNDNGGVAVGPFQIHSTYMLVPFFNYLKNNAPSYFNMLNEKGGVMAIKRNNPEMRKFFCNLCNDKNFIKLQENFIDKENFQPRLKSLKSNYGLDISSRSSSIEAILRVMSANIGWRTNDVICDMVKNISSDMDINSISDMEFVEVLQKSIHTIIKKDIQPRFRNQLLNAYDKTITKDIIPNIEKENLVKARQEKINKLHKDMESFKNDFASVTLFEKTKSVVNNQINDKNNININNAYLVKKNEEEIEVYSQKSSSDNSSNKSNKSKKSGIITVQQIKKKDESDVINKNRPSLLRRAELILMQEKLANEKKELENQKRIEKASSVKVARASKDDVLTVDKVIAKAKRNRNKNDTYVSQDFSALLKEASSYII